MQLTAPHPTSPKGEGRSGNLELIIRVMKLTAILLFAICMQVAARSDGQTVTLSVKNAPIKEVFREIQKQTGLNLVVNEKILSSAGKVTLDVRNMPVAEVLKLCLRNEPLSFSIIDGTIVIKSSPSILNQNMLDALPPPITVRGRVVNENGEPVRATVTVKGTSNAISTNDNGEFVLENVDENASLIITGISVQRLEVKVNGRTNLNVSIKTKVAEGEDIIIKAGYYDVKKREATGSISRVDAKTIEKQPVSNPLQALQGRMSGVNIQQSTGIPGGGFKIEIRGRNSLRTGADGGIDGNLPLYVVDGVPFTSTSLTSGYISGSLLSSGNPLSTINPSEIESIEVLKDADATAIYGSRGANGVVLITTKRAKTAKTKVEANVNKGIGRVPHFMNLLNTQQYLTMRNEAFTNDAEIPDMFNAPDLIIWDTTRYTDWQKELIGGTSHNINANVSLAGGNEQTQFTFGGGYYRETSVLPGLSRDNAFQRVSGRLTIRHQSENKKLSIESSINYSSSINKLPTIDFTGLATTLAPNAPKLFDESGNLNWENSTWTNPLASLKRRYKGVIDNLITSASLGYEVLTGLNIKSTLGYTTMQVNEMSTSPLSAYDPADLQNGRTGSSVFGESGIKTWIIEPQADYKKKIGNGILSILIGGTFQQSTQQGKAIDGYGYTSDAFLQNISAATTLNISENTSSDYRYAASFARLNYNWNKKYIINLTGRRDGSSRFGPGRRFANFGAVGTAWIFSEENFIKSHLPFLSFGKLRMSYGTTGSDAIGNYQFLQTYSATSYPYANTSGLALTRLANPDYSWEVNKKFEAAFELGFIDDRIMLSGSYYLNRSTNQLVGLPLPAITGQSNVQFNLPATVENKGWEIQVSTKNIDKDHFKWTTDFNITLPQNMLVKFPDLEKFPAYVSRYDVGKSIYSYKAFQFNQVDPQSGLYSMVDLNNDGNISFDSDYTALKKVTQTLFGGIGNSFQFKGIQLDFFFQFVQQTGFDYRLTYIRPGTLSNQPTDVLERWQKPNDISRIQQFSALDPTGAVSSAYYENVSSDNLVTDASFIRMKNISLSWQLPPTWMKRVKLEGCRIYFQGQNLFTITKFIGLDPETQLSTSLPPLRVLTAGINLSL